MKLIHTRLPRRAAALLTGLFVLAGSGFISAHAPASSAAAAQADLAPTNQGILTIVAPEGGTLQEAYTAYRIGSWKTAAATKLSGSGSSDDSSSQTVTAEPSSGIAIHDLDVAAAGGAALAAAKTAIAGWNAAHGDASIPTSETGMDAIGQIARLNPADPMGQEQIAGLAQRLAKLSGALTKAGTLSAGTASATLQATPGWYLIVGQKKDSLPILLGTADARAPQDTWLAPRGNASPADRIWQRLGVMYAKNPGTSGDDTDVHPQKRTRSASGEWVQSAAIRHGDSTAYQLRLTLPTGQNGAATRGWITDTMRNIALKPGCEKVYVHHGTRADADGWEDESALSADGWDDVTKSVPIAENGKRIAITSLDSNHDTTTVTAPASGFVLDLTALLADQQNWGRRVAVYVTGTPTDDQGEDSAIQSFTASFGWSHEPGTPPQTTTTHDVRTVNKSYPLELVKTDLSDPMLRLQGAQFVLSYDHGNGSSSGNASAKAMSWQRLRADGTWTDSSRADATAFTTDKNGRVTIPGLGAGRYKLSEIAAPRDYCGSSLALPSFDIDVTDDGTMTMHETTGKDRLLVAQDAGSAEGTGASLTVANIRTLAQLPQTGTTAMLALLSGTAILFAVALLLLALSRKHSR